MRTSRPQNILLTGATGLIGGEIATKLCQDRHRVWALVRARSEREAVARLEGRFARSGKNLPAGIIPVCGDICTESLGLKESVLRVMRDKCDSVVHAAGETTFRDGKECRATNVEGAQKIIQEVERWNREPGLFFISTSYVTCGPKHCEIEEDWSQGGVANAYIESKRDAERLFRESDLDVVILRPSIVVSKGIPDRRFARSLLWFVLVACELGQAPLDENARVDIVPAAYVADCAARLIGRRLNFRCYHLSAGAELSVRCKDVADLIRARNNTVVTFVSQSAWLQQRMAGSKRAGLMRAMDYYTAFINADVTYSPQRIRNELEDEMPECPKFTEYSHELLGLIKRKEAICESADP